MIEKGKGGVKSRRMTSSRLSSLLKASNDGEDEEQRNRR